ncbi:MAG: hypothetical protein JWQ40_2683 [Segetibacter sp.]|nr:hypothetical protein [Segetibacter sp.]
MISVEQALKIHRRAIKRFGGQMVSVTEVV